MVDTLLLVNRRKPVDDNSHGGESEDGSDGGNDDGVHMM